MRSSNRLWGLAGVSVVIVASLLFVSFRPRPVLVDLYTIGHGPMQVTVDADGKTRIRDVYEVAAPIAGLALRAPVEVGDQVLAGETVVASVEPISPGLLDLRSRVQAQAAVEEAEAALHVAESRLRQAEEDLKYAESQYARAQNLAERGAISISRLEQAEQELAIKQAERDAVRAGIAMAESSLARARAALIEPGSAASAEAESCCVELRAPIDGEVLSVDVVSERPVTSGERLVTIGQPGDLEIVAELLSTDAVRLVQGARAIVERWGGPIPLEAVLRDIEPSAFTKISTLGIEEQRVEAVLDFVSPPADRAGLGDGYSVFLRIVEWQSEDAVQVPLSALFRDGGDWVVFVADEGRVRKQVVEIGKMGDSAAEVLGGLSPGVMVILYPGDAIDENVRIAPRGAE